MPFALGYKTSKGITYLTSKNGWATDINTPHIRFFESTKAGRTFYANHHNSDLQGAFTNRKSNKLIMVNQQNPQDIQPIDPQQYNLYNHHCSDIPVHYNNMAEFTQVLRNPKNHIMILDLEFFQDVDNNRDTYPRQIAAHIFNTHADFNIHIFSNDSMPLARQIEFLKSTDLPYSAAKNFQLDNVINHFRSFMLQNDVNIVLSWDNSLDFQVLHQQVDPQLFKNIKSIDLSQLVSQIITGNNATQTHVMSLSKFTNLLNLPHTGKWHDAADDVQAINRICLNYYNQTNNPI